MPITLPTLSAAGAGVSTSDIKARLTPRFDFSTTRGKAVAIIFITRAFYNFVHFLGLLNKHPLLALLFVVDQLVITYSVNVIADAEGERTVCGVRVRGEHFELLLVVFMMVHLLYALALLALIFSGLIFFGVGSGITYAIVMVVVGLAMLPVAWLASRPEDGDGNLSLP